MVGRHFTADRPGAKLVGDTSYLRTWTGRLYLATVIDCCTRQVIGWSMATHMPIRLRGSTRTHTADGRLLTCDSTVG
jgi:putative transposase